jgi:hypothetical protein
MSATSHQPDVMPVTASDARSAGHGPSGQLEILALPHPDRVVRQRLGFDLTHPYVEQCWGALIGPSGVLVLRRLPTLWAEREPAAVDTHEFARSLGLGGGSGPNGSFTRALDRLTQFQLATWIERGAALGVYTQVGPVSEGRMRRLPSWTRDTHARLVRERHNEQAGERASGTGATSDWTRDRLSDCVRVLGHHDAARPEVDLDGTTSDASGRGLS